jgi:hypothetical protein
VRASRTAQLGFRNAIWEACNSAATDEQSGVVHAREELRYLESIKEKENKWCYIGATNNLAKKKRQDNNKRLESGSIIPTYHGPPHVSV